MILKRYANNDDRAWKYILDSGLKDVRGKFLLRCNFDVSKLPINVPAFYKGCLHSWSSLVKWTNETTDGVLQQPIWNNKFICIQNKSVYYSCFKNVGLVTIGDMLSQTGTFLGYDELEKESNHLNIFDGWVSYICTLFLKNGASC